MATSISTAVLCELDPLIPPPALSVLGEINTFRLIGMDGPLLAANQLGALWLVANRLQLSGYNSIIIIVSLFRQNKRNHNWLCAGSG